MQSMTGFGRAEGSIADGHYIAEIKSVNHKFLDARFRLPAPLTQVETRLSQILKSNFKRGSFEITIKEKRTGDKTTSNLSTRFFVDLPAARSFLQCCQTLHQELKIPKTPSLESLLMAGSILFSEQKEIDDSKLLAEAQALFENALKDLGEWRHREGESLKLCLKEQLATLTELAQRVNTLAGEQPKKIREKLQDRIKQWDMASKPDPQRLEWEIAYYAERSDITEEIDRIHSHFKAFEILLEEAGSVGRKLDFFSQEMNREINTIGAKASLTSISHLVVEMKTQIEKLREQIQNVE